MTDTLTITLAQLNPTVGDIVGNTQKLREARVTAAELGADLLVASELVCFFERKISDMIQ